MNTMVFYSFNIYLKNPNNVWTKSNSSTCSIQWDTIIILCGSNLEDAVSKIPEEYRDWKIVKVDYPIGYPNFPMFSPSNNTAGYQYN